MRVSGPITPDEALRIYLQDHHAGARAGIALVHRAVGNHDGTAAQVLRQLAAEFEEDERVLREVMTRVGAHPSPVKDAGAKVAEFLGRFKLNGQLLGTSPLSPIVELEGLVAGVTAKQHLWTALRDATDVAVPGFDPGAMIERAEDQLDRLRDLWREAARAAFPDGATAATSAG